MAQPITRGSISALLSPQYRQVYFEAGEERALEYPLVLHTGDMEWNPVTDQQAAGLGQMPGKPEGTQFPTDSLKIGGTVSYTAAPYGLAVEITFEAWRDELYGTLQEMIKGLARAARYRQEVQAWSNLNNAFTGGAAGFDSAQLCATSHTRLDGGTSANRPSPDISFSVSGIQASIMRYETMVNERGLPQVMSPNLALIPPQKKWVAREILGSGGVPYKADNEINALIAEDLGWMVCHYFTSTTAWFLVNKEAMDIHFLWRDREFFDMFDDPRTKNAVATAYQRFASAFGSWRGIDGSTG